MSTVAAETSEPKVLQPYDLLQVNINEFNDSHHIAGPHYLPPPHLLPADMPDPRIIAYDKLFRPECSEFGANNWMFFGHHFIDQPISSKPSEGTLENIEEKKASRSIKQRLRRINESDEEKEARRSKNREINRRRRANLNKTGISTEKSKNRLRQRIKREITRMLRTGTKRDDFLEETFSDVKMVFSEEEFQSLYQRVLETTDFIQNKIST